LYNSSYTQILTKSFKGFSANPLKGFSKAQERKIVMRVTIGDILPTSYRTDRIYRIETGRFDILTGNAVFPIHSLIV